MPSAPARVSVSSHLLSVSSHLLSVSTHLAVRNCHRFRQLPFCSNSTQLSLRCMTLSGYMTRLTEVCSCLWPWSSHKQHSLLFQLAGISHFATAAVLWQRMCLMHITCSRFMVLAAACRPAKHSSCLQVELGAWYGPRTVSYGKQPKDSRQCSAPQDMMTLMKGSCARASLTNA